METVIYFKGQNLAIFTWKGATIEIENHDHLYHEHRLQNPGGYGDQKSQMRELVNLNHILEQMRAQALNQKYSGPRVFITGNQNSGKTSITRTLVNYAVKLGWSPLLVDLDVTQNTISAPGCLSAALIENILEG